MVSSSQIEGDSKRWTRLNSKQHLNTCQTIGCGIPNSLLALRVDLRGLAQNTLEFVSRFPLIHVVGRSFTQTAYLLKLVIPTTNTLLVRGGI